MSTIKPPAGRALEKVSEPARVATPSAPEVQAETREAPLAPVQSGAPSAIEAPPPQASSDALQSIGSLSKHELFGKGAKVQPLRAGVQALDGPQDPSVLSQDLNRLFAEAAAEDPSKRAAIEALLQAYPGGADALKGIP